jgi:hypothetical protein
VTQLNSGEGLALEVWGAFEFWTRVMESDKPLGWARRDLFYGTAAVGWTALAARPAKFAARCACRSGSRCRRETNQA